MTQSILEMFAWSASDLDSYLSVVTKSDYGN